MMFIPLKPNFMVSRALGILLGGIVVLSLAGCDEQDQSSTAQPNSFRIPEIFEDSIPKEVLPIRFVGSQKGFQVVFRSDNRNIWGLFTTQDDLLGGEMKLYYPGGQVYRAGFYRNEILDGDLISYWENGQVRWIHPVRRGLQEGQRVYFDSLGQKLAQWEVSRDKREGLGQEFFPNGGLRYEGHFHEGFPVGKHYAYDSTGRMIALHYYGKRCLEPPCHAYWISFDSTGAPIDSFGTGGRTNEDRLFYGVIRRDTFAPSIHDSSIHLDYLLGRD